MVLEKKIEQLEFDFMKDIRKKEKKEECGVGTMLAGNIICFGIGPMVGLYSGALLGATITGHAGKFLQYTYAVFSQFWGN